MPLALFLLAVASGRTEEPAGGAVVPKAEQRLVYDLAVDGATVGRRDVAIRYLPGPNGEIRVIESWTEAELPAIGRVRARATSRSSATGSSFTSSIDEGGAVREVQCRQLPGGRWQVVVVDGSGARTWELRPSEVTATSLMLLDPVERSRFTSADRPRVLVAESGAVIEGPIEALGDGTEPVGGAPVSVERWAWSPPGERQEFAWSQDGLLVGWSAQLPGVTLTGALRDLPPPRSWGEADAQPTGGMTAEDL